MGIKVCIVTALQERLSGQCTRKGAEKIKYQKQNTMTCSAAPYFGNKSRKLLN